MLRKGVREKKKNEKLKKRKEVANVDKKKQTMEKVQSSF